MLPPLVSVIIPIYNVSRYLKECLDSVVSQTYKHLEIILINDGSEDGSEEIAREYLYDPRVQLISQINKGLSAARNVGMKKASGAYIMFVDSDDYLSLNYIAEMVEIAIRFDVEMVCNEAIVRFGRTRLSNPQRKEPQRYVPDSHNIVFGGAVWRFLFLRQFLERCGVEFLEGKVYEDEAFLYMISPFCNAFVRYCGEYYFYRQRDDSIMAQHKNFRNYDLLDVFRSIYLYYQSNCLLEHFSPPYYFLYDCAIGYSNEKEYLDRAEKLSKELGAYPYFFKRKILYKLGRFSKILYLIKRVVCARKKKK
ncbi:glycosyltransferase family 2 protein [Helicobacter kayseriensis]|uniref:glycosyltransferase family 2 protein n=1 Tax=Helicobacter kayseriensis TaxID=2905877 RepID=UPI001E38C5B5|nr:glycosyltransferase family A protein [Helicobacter kayseriensis]MCE3047222.1 glycosyltransferase family 2 protein [Helicobacter kayseriensis]MCE3048593.1 glycosyltransferase family 2 protein [Helicobacter kayseriensis]